MTKQPAITSVFPVKATTDKKIKFLQRQITELELQKKCYDKMIRDRKKAIKTLQMSKTMTKYFSKIGSKAKKRPRRKRR